MPQHPELTVFYDGFCPVCSREIAGYRRLKLNTHIEWLDLAARDDVLVAETFSQAEALELLHVKDAAGVLHVGLAAHLLLWQHLPGFNWCAVLLRKNALLHAICDRGYRFFTRHRPGQLRRKLQRKAREFTGASQ
jgi:predicted DCC family thiol-disulfide oxidoreductase YuxK